MAPASRRIFGDPAEAHKEVSLKSFWSSMATSAGTAGRMVAGVVAGAVVAAIVVAIAAVAVAVVAVTAFSTDLAHLSLGRFGSIAAIYSRLLIAGHNYSEPSEWRLMS